MEGKLRGIGESYSDATQKLKVESQRMEERLKMLRQVMAVEKTQRENSVTVGYWKAGQKGPLTRKKDGNTKNVEVKHEKKKPFKVKVLTGKEQEDTGNSKIQCGQCEQYKASISCVECTEDYCTVCFAKMHQKGALSKHHIRPLAKMKECTKPSIPATTKTSTSTGTGTDTSTGTGTSTAGTVHEIAIQYKPEHNGSLLDGTYSEEVSAASFKEAVAAWREGRKVTTPTSTTTSTSTIATRDSSVSTNQSYGVQAIPSSLSSHHHTSLVDDNHNITFSVPAKTSTYLEDLMIKKKRRDPSFLSLALLRTTSSLSHDSHVTSNDISDDDEQQLSPSAYNLFYDADDEVSIASSPQPYITNSTPSHAEHYRPTSSLHIEPLAITTAIEPLEHESNGTPVEPLDHVSSGMTKDNTTNDTDAPVNAGHDTSKDRQSCKELKKNTDSAKLIDNKESTRVSTKAKASKSKKDEKAKDGEAKSRQQSRKSARRNEKAEPVASNSVEDSIEAAWKKASLAHVSTRTDLSHLFLTLVGQREGFDQALDEEREQPDSKDTPAPLPISSTIWLPSSSIVGSDAVTFSDAGISHFDLPPPSQITPSLSHSHMIGLDTDKEESCSDSEDILNVEDENYDEMDKADNSALEDLAWELASIHNKDETLPDLSLEEEAGLRALSRMTMQELMADFEEYEANERELEQFES